MLVHRQVALKHLFMLLFVFAALSGPVAFAQAQNSYEDLLAQGVTNFKAGRYGDAIQAFKKAVALDPTSSTAKLYLGTAYAYEVVPNLQTPANLANAENAIEMFKQIPETDPSYHTALKQLAWVYRNVGRFDEARDSELEALKLLPDDDAAHYTIGVIDWTQAYKFSASALASEGLTDDGLGNAHMSYTTCEKIKTHNAPLVDDAIVHLSRAIDLNPKYSDAMAYLNLVYRRRADFDCADAIARAQDINLADLWLKRSYAARPQVPPVTSPP